MDLIDRENLLKELKTSADHHEENSRDYVLMLRDRNIVREQPTVEAIPREKIEDIKAEIENMLSDGMIHKKTVIGIIDKHMESENKDGSNNN